LLLLRHIREKHSGDESFKEKFLQSVCVRPVVADDTPVTNDDTDDDVTGNEDHHEESEGSDFTMSDDDMMTESKVTYDDLR